MQFDLNCVRRKNRRVKKKRVKILTGLMPYIEKSCRTLLFLYIFVYFSKLPPVLFLVDNIKMQLNKLESQTVVNVVHCHWYAGV